MRGAPPGLGLRRGAGCCRGEGWGLRRGEGHPFPSGEFSQNAEFSVAGRAASVRHSFPGADVLAGIRRDLIPSQRARTMVRQARCRRQFGLARMRTDRRADEIDPRRRSPQPASVAARPVTPRIRATSDFDITYPVAGHRRECCSDTCTSGRGMRPTGSEVTPKYAGVTINGFELAAMTVPPTG